MMEINLLAVLETKLLNLFKLILAIVFKLLLGIKQKYLLYAQHLIAISLLVEVMIILLKYGWLKKNSV